MAGFLRVSMLGLLLFLTTIVGTHSFNILGLFPHPGFSHFQFFSPIMRGLAEAGHEVTVISHFPDKSPPEHYRDLPLTGRETLHNAIDLQMFDTFYAYNHFVEFFLLNDWGKDACNHTLNSAALAQILSEKTRYDVIILEQFNTDCLMGVAHILKAPVIGLSSTAMMPWHYDRMGAPTIPSYMPALFMGQSEEMKFTGRLANWLTIHLMKLMYRHISMPAADALLQEKFGPNFPSVVDLVKETNVFFTNQHFSYNGAKPLPTSVVELGGIHIQAAKPLAAELKRFLDNAKHGVVYISWGSMIRAESLTPAKRDGIMNAVRRLKQRVIWKFENDTLPNKPDNMLISKWLPQRDILCHPNVKVFMTHAGLMGSSEAVHCGVPMVMTPMYGDQYLNAAALKYRGMGEILRYEQISESSVFQTVEKILEKQYLANARKISHAYKHRPQTALQTAIWWVEYVAQTKGAPLTKSASVDMSRFVYYSLDIYLLFASVIAVMVLSWLAIYKKFLLRRKQLDKIKQN